MKHVLFHIASVINLSYIYIHVFFCILPVTSRAWGRTRRSGGAEGSELVCGHIGC